MRLAGLLATPAATHGRALAQDTAHGAVSLKATKPDALHAHPSQPPSTCPADVPPFELGRCMKAENAAIDRSIDKRMSLAINLLRGADMSDEDKAKGRQRLQRAACETVFDHQGGGCDGTLEDLDRMRQHGQSRLADPGPSLHGQTVDE